MPGAPVADAVFADLIPRIEKLKENGHTPGLATVLVGEDDASARYVGMKMRKAEELGERADAERGWHDQHIRIAGDQDDRREILDRIEWQLWIDPDIRAVRARGGHEQRVAVGRAPRHCIGGDVAARAGAVLDDHRLAEAHGKLLAHHARQHVGRRARPDGDEDAHRLLRVALPRGIRGDAERKERGDQAHLQQHTPRRA